MAKKVWKLNRKIRKKSATRKKGTLCWDCAVCDCSWMAGKFIPVEGWDAEPTVIEGNSSYHVKSCPQFAKPEPRILLEMGEELCG